MLFVHNLNDVIQLLEMASHKEKKNLAKENKLLLMELPYYNCKDLKNAHLARRLTPTRSITLNRTLI